MIVVDNSNKIALTSAQFETLKPVLELLDNKLKTVFTVELSIFKDSDGNVFLDAVKKPRGGFKRKRRQLLD